MNTFKPLRTITRILSEYILCSLLFVVLEYCLMGISWTFTILLLLLVLLNEAYFETRYYQITKNGEVREVNWLGISRNTYRNISKVERDISRKAIRIIADSGNCYRWHRMQDPDAFMGELCKYYPHLEIEQ